MAIEKFMENMAAWDGGVKDLKELGTNICFHLLVKDRVEPKCLSFFRSLLTERIVVHCITFSNFSS